LNRTSDAFDTQAQAAAWLVRLEAGSSAATMELWQQWLSEDARHRAAYARVESSWRQSDCLRRLRPLDGKVNLNLLDTFPGLPPRSRVRWRRGGADGLSFLKAACSALTVAVAAGALASLLVLACWFLFQTGSSWDP
jgi:ferric-dicitrate binding protein FerR (iron transport regulator)